jgi:Spy/CpxP family protein refolding chaperone
MDIFAQKKLLIRIIVVLAVLNLLSIGVFLWKDVFPPPRRMQVPAESNRDASSILEKELNLTREQAEQIRSLRRTYNEKEKDYVASIRIQRDSMNTEMFNGSTREEVIQSLARRIAENEYNLEMLRFEQAKQLKSICTPEQVEKFNRLVREMRDYFKPDNQPGKKQKRNPPKRKDQPQ